MPVFRKVVGCYEVYYLQMYESMLKREMAAVQSCMEKGISRIAAWYHSQEEIGEAHLVYDAPFANWLRQQQREEYWQKLWDLPLYKEYKEPHNLNLLLAQIPKACLPKEWIILGEALGMQEWIGQAARYVKSIRVYSLIPPKGWEQMKERLLEEYGLMLTWQKSLQPVSEEPALVLDYCSKEKVYVWGVKSGSIWVDMNSLESRRHGILDRETGIQYVSLKCFWKEEMIQTLDTVSKIQYNTEVKLEGEVGV